MQKTCSKCGEDKDIDKYNDTIILTKRSDCKTCQSNYTKAYYLANKARIRANENLRRANYKKFNLTPKKQSL